MRIKFGFILWECDRCSWVRVCVKGNEDDDDDDVDSDDDKPYFHGWESGCISGTHTHSG